MLDHLKSEEQRTGGAQTRLRMYMAVLLLLGAVVFGISQTSGKKKGPEQLPTAPVNPAAVEEKPRIDRAKLPATDDASTQSGWATSALEYLRGIVEGDFTTEARLLSIAQLDALPFAEARGGVFEVEGTVEALVEREFGRGSGRLWAVLLEDGAGGRAIVLKFGFASDPLGGRPEEAQRMSTELVAVGQRIIARGIYVQRRVGTVGTAILRDPVPVLVATPPAYAFRRIAERAAPIESPDEADWEDVDDRYLEDTTHYDDTALYQMLAWARAKGHDAIAAGIKDGEMPSTLWNQDTFVTWSDEIMSDDASAPRPFTEAARGKLFRTRGLVANFVRDGWDAVPIKGSEYGVNDFHVFDVQSDHYGNAVIRTISAFPVSDYAGVGVKPGQHVTIYGYFLKNHTYETRIPREGGGAALRTLPLFVVVHAEPVKETESQYQKLIWGVTGLITLLALLFYFVLIRGERKEAARMETYRTNLRRRRRARDSADPDAPTPPRSDASIEKDDAGS